MINHEAFEAVEQSKWQGFSKPLYDSFSFSKIPGTILKLLGLDEEALPQSCWIPGPYEKVICILVDGFGWSFLEKYHAQYPFLSRFFRQGLVSKITSQFPSTTAAHITTLTTGLEVGETGVFEWFYYEPRLDRMIAPLLYAFAGDKESGTLQSVITPDKILPNKTIFQKLKQHGIRSHIFQHESIAHSVYSKTMFNGGEMVAYRQISDCLNSVKERLLQKGLFYIYYGDIDSEAHRHGMEAPQTMSAIERCFTSLEQFFSSADLQNTAVILTADHGMMPIDPKTTIYLNREMPEIEKLLRVGRDNHALAPGGSCRDFFIYAKEVNPMFELLHQKLEGKALVCKTEDLIEQQFFGSKPVSENFRKRVGNLIIFPYGNLSIWWYEKGRFEQKFYAMHGGLTKEELETIFLFIKG